MTAFEATEEEKNIERKAKKAKRKNSERHFCALLSFPESHFFDWLTKFRVAGGNVSSFAYTVSSFLFFFGLFIYLFLLFCLHTENMKNYINKCEDE